MINYKAVTTYTATIKGWHVEVDARSLKGLKKIGIQVAKNLEIKSFQLVNVKKHVEITKKLKPLTIKL